METSIHNLANKLKISIKLQTYFKETGKNIFMQCKQLQTIFKMQEINNNAMKIYYASTELMDRVLN